MPRDYWAAWSDEDPAVRNVLDALHPAPDAPERPIAPAEEPERTPAAATLSRRERVAQLYQRLRAGDLSARDLLSREMTDE